MNYLQQFHSYLRPEGCLLQLASSTGGALFSKSIYIGRNIMHKCCKYDGGMMIDLILYCKNVIRTAEIDFFPPEWIRHTVADEDY